MKYIVDGIDISSLLIAQDRFEEFRKDMRNDRDEAGAIQAFEFTLELAWKTMKRICEVDDLVLRSPRDVVREAARGGLIDDPAIWFKFLDLRNIASHTYDAENVQAVIECFGSFSQALYGLVGKLKESAEK